MITIGRLKYCEYPASLCRDYRCLPLCVQSMVPSPCDGNTTPRFFRKKRKKKKKLRSSIAQVRSSQLPSGQPPGSCVVVKVPVNSGLRLGRSSASPSAILQSNRPPHPHPLGQREPIPTSLSLGKESYPPPTHHNPNTPTLSTGILPLHPAHQG